MSEGKGQGEPSMEEILASIRRIISEDGDAQTAGAADSAPMAASRGGMMSSDVFDLVDEAPPSARGTGLDDLMGMLDDDDAMSGVVNDDFDGAGIMSPGAAGETAARFAQLAAMADRDIPQQVQPRLSSGNPTLDELVREALKPVLREWLDRNLPPMVEQMVRGEIERLASAGRRR
ncbi:DUF2497 domain-containing protein [Lacibacterium aquatile]|uniref:DUF2497 domain-containing protein n=1 Tax=Lacibacterium aquatile TaxID=1168082 RepID=A0ABW5DQL4_9PROT